jgi:hypothetical protein
VAQRAREAGHKTRPGEVRLHTRSKLHILLRTQQTIEHLYKDCGRTHILFKKFEKHYKLDTELT